MRNTNTIHRRNSIVLIIIFFCFLPLLWSSFYGQIQYATAVVSESNVTNSGQSIDADESTYSELESGSGLVIGIGSYESHIELSFPAPVQADETFYMKIETDDDLLSGLLAGTLGSLVSDVLGLVLQGNQEFTVQVKDVGGNVVLSGNSANASTFSGERLKVVTNNNGEIYLAITPSQSYQSVLITNKVGSLLGLGSKRKMRVYDPYYYMTPVSCQEPKFTSYSGSGISLELLNLGGGVINIERGIDQNLNTFSTLSLGVVSVASSSKQYFYFEAPILPNDVYGIHFSLDPALLTINIAQNIRIITQKGAAEVTNEPISTYLTPGNMADLNNGLPTTIFVSPNDTTNRLVVDFNGILGVTLQQSLQINEVFLVTHPPVIDITASDTLVCEGSSANLLAIPSDTTKEVRWYDDEFATTPVYVGAYGSTFVTGVLTNDTVFWVAAGISGCPSESNRVPVLVEVIDAPTSSNIVTHVSPYYCASDSVILSVENLGGDDIDMFSWFFDANLSQPVVTSQNANGYSYFVDNDTLIIYDIIAGDSTFNLYVTYQDTVTGCQNIIGDELVLTVNIEDVPVPTSSSTEQTFCPEDLATVNDIDVNESNVNWYDANGDALLLTDLLVDGEYYYATTYNSNCESSDTLEVLINVNVLPAPTTSSTVQTFCPEALPTVADIDVNEVNVNWYDEEGNLMTAFDFLIDGGNYYGTTYSLTCESNDTLMVSIIIEPLAPPTTDFEIQSFCIQDNPTVADIEVNDTLVQWYDEQGNLLTNNTPLVNGTSYFATNVNGVCESNEQLEVLVYVLAADEVEIEASNDVVCFNDTISYEALPGMISYDWTVSGGIIVAGGSSTENTITVVWNENNGGQLHLAFETTSGCTVEMENALNVGFEDCSELVIQKTASNYTPSIGSQVEFVITAFNDGPSDITGILIAEQLQSGFTYISHQESHGSYDVNLGEWSIPLLTGGETATLTIQVKVNPSGVYKNVATVISTNEEVVINELDSSVELETECFTVYNEFSPNGDGVNDHLQIDCIEQYPQNSITIFNRYGNVVYKTEGYNNDWNGIANVSGVVSKGETLPVGTYYYLLEIEEANVKTSGWIYLVR